MVSGWESIDSFSSSSGLSQAPVLLCCRKQWMDDSKCLIFDQLQKHVVLLICEKTGSDSLLFLHFNSQKKHSVHWSQESSLKFCNWLHWSVNYCVTSQHYEASQAWRHTSKCRDYLSFYPCLWVIKYHSLPTYVTEYEQRDIQLLPLSYICGRKLS